MSIRLTRTLLAAACLTHGLAYAQSSGASSVTLSGQATVGVTSKSNQTGGTTNRELTNSVLDSSYIGLRGSEDLGDGMSAFFRLESGLNMNNGVAGASVAGTQKFWTRFAFVGLNANRNLSISAGRQFLPHADRAILTLDVYNLAGTTLHTTPLGLFGVNRFSGNDTRTDSSIKLRWRGDDGFSAGLGVGLNDGAGRVVSADVAQVTRDYAIAAYAAKFESPTPIVGKGDQRAAHEVVGGGGWVNWGSTRWFLHIFDSKLDSTLAAGVTQKNLVIAPAVAWTVNPTVTVKAALYHDKGTDLNGVPGRDGTKDTVVASAHYALSRRSSLYAAVFSNKFDDGYKLDPVNIIALGRDPSASTTTGFSVGMRHDF